MDECEHSGMCPNGECINMDGSYKCICKDGYKQSPNQQICIGNITTNNMLLSQTCISVWVFVNVVCICMGICQCCIYFLAFRIFKALCYNTADDSVICICT